MLTSRSTRRARGRRRRRSRAPDHRRLPLRQGLQLPRPRLLRRPHPRSRWSAPAPRATASSAARAGTRRSTSRRGGLRGGDRRARRRVGAPLQLHGHPGGDPGRLDREPVHERDRRERARADDLRHAPGSPAWSRPTASRPRSTRRSGTTPATCWSGAGTRCRPRLTCGGRSSTRAATGPGSCVVDPFRSRTARVADEHLRPLPGTDAALALGMMRAIVDAGLVDEEWCRAHTDGYRGAARAPRRAPGRALGGDLRRARRADRRGRRATSPAPSRRCCGSGSVPSATSAPRSPTGRSPACRRWSAPGATAAAAAPTSRPRPPARSRARVARRGRAARRRGRAGSTCRSSVRRSPTRTSSRR